ncbi:MAG TPA: MBL fold metallo-hydrolase [Phnomibacter sp.]|nr:MBL fold metallo-hydrolase [Phnomibacter sp.]
MLRIVQFTFNPIQENTYLLYNEAGEAALIDTGCYFDAEKQQLTQFIEEHKLQVKWLLQTHCHLDHIFGLHWAVQTFGIEPYIHENEKPVLAYGDLSGEKWNLPFTNYRGPVQLLTEGQEIQMGKDKLKVIFAPGHSPGHVCFYCEAQDFLIGGDVLFQRSIGRTDLPGGSHQQLLTSIREQLFTLPDATVVHPGHGPSTTIGEEKEENPFLQ